MKTVYFIEYAHEKIYYTNLVQENNVVFYPIVQFYFSLLSLYLVIDRNKREKHFYHINGIVNGFGICC